MFGSRAWVSEGLLADFPGPGKSRCSPDIHRDGLWGSTGVFLPSHCTQGWEGFLNPPQLPLVPQASALHISSLELLVLTMPLPPQRRLGCWCGQ